MRPENVEGEPEVDDLRNHSLGDLMKKLTLEVRTLVRQEAEMARAEIVEKGRRAVFGVSELSAAALVAVFSLGALTVFFIAALALVVPLWAAALAVAGIYGMIAGILAMKGRRQLGAAMPPTPERTIETIKEDLEWASNQPKSKKT